MSYTNNVPQANQKIAATQQPIYNNFAYIDTAVKLNHTWTSNAIAGEAPGSHQRMDMPNQGADIAVLPTGIAAVLYAIGGNIFSYNGAKNCVSAVNSGAALTNISETALTILTVPNDCFGFISSIITVSSVPKYRVDVFYSIGGTFITLQITAPVSGVNITTSGLNLQVNKNGSATTDFTYKTIYWPL